MFIYGEMEVGLTSQINWLYKWVLKRHVQINDMKYRPVWDSNPQLLTRWTVYQLSYWGKLYIFEERKEENWIKPGFLKKIEAVLDNIIAG